MPSLFLPSRRRSLKLALGAAAGLALPAVLHAAPAKAPDDIYAQSFSGLDGADVAMQSFLGKPLVLNFWATWCPPCVKEMPDLDALYKAHPDIGFLGLAVDSEVNVRKFIEKVQVSYPLLLSGHGGIKLMRALGNRQGGLPFTVLFDAEGRLQRRLLGQIKPKELDGFIRELS